MHLLIQKLLVMCIGYATGNILGILAKWILTKER